MNPFSNPKVTRRFIILMAIATFAMFSFWAIVKSYTQSEPGDYEVRQGDIFLTDKKFAEALDRFDAALKLAPHHRGAMMGRALVFMMDGNENEAEAEFTQLIAFLQQNLTPDDRTGIGTLAAAYNNRGILRDRQCRHKEALADYIEALKTDEGAVDGPGIVNKIIHRPNPSNARKRAQFLYERRDKLEDGKCLRIPELDDEERVYKP